MSSVHKILRHQLVYVTRRSSLYAVNHWCRLFSITTPNQNCSSDIWKGVCLFRNRQTQYREIRRTLSRSAPEILPPPTVVYSDNHLLVVHKPAGWHSVPNLPKQRKTTNPSHQNWEEIFGSKKCLLTHLQSKGLGGGSHKDFLLPLHRIDQPCTGILLFGKTTKAASRITAVWKGKAKNRKRKTKSDGGESRRGVVKEYLCVVPTSRLANIQRASSPLPAAVASDSAQHEETDPRSSKERCEGPTGSNVSSDSVQSRYFSEDEPGIDWNQLDGLMLRKSASSSSFNLYHNKNTQRHLRDRHLRKGQSVRIVKRQSVSGSDDNKHDSFLEYDHEIDHSLMRPVGVRWKVVPVPSINPAYTLLLVRTSEGARHMVRALLAQVGDCPIAGDLRYWKSGSITKTPTRDDVDGVPLQDRSVALHAYGVYLNPNQLQLGSLDIFGFRAHIPSTWKFFFGLDHDQVEQHLPP